MEDLQHLSEFLLISVCPAGQNHHIVRVICDTEGFVVDVYVQSVLHRVGSSDITASALYPRQVTWSSLIFLLISCKMGTCVTFQRCLALEKPLLKEDFSSGVIYCILPSSYVCWWLEGRSQLSQSLNCVRGRRDKEITSQVL